MKLFLSILPWIQIVLSVLLIISVLLQQSDAGLGTAFGGQTGDNFRRTKRGFEKVLFISTIVLGILFGLSATFALFFS